jgi:hypothetical protein
MSKSSCLALFVVVSILLNATAQVRAQFAPVEPPPSDLAVGFNSITPQQAKEWLTILASPEFEGRGTGQQGYVKAAHWMAGQVAELGLKPVGDGGTYFQMLPMQRRIPVMDECRITGPQNLEIIGEGNFGFERYTDEPEVIGEAVFICFSGNSVEFPEELILRDKIVFYVTDDAAAAKAPRVLARKRPAAAIRIIEGEPKSIPQLIRGAGSRRRSSRVSGTISTTAVNQILNALEGEASWIQPVEQAGAVVHETGQQLTIAVRVREEPAGVPNVVAWLEGSDPTVSHEYVVIGAHLDHLGIRSGTTYPGADDNGSGSTAVLSIAKAFASNPTRPRRSVLFIWFAAEEIGLVGSRHYCDNPLLPVRNMTCMFNIDMVGRNEETSDETAEENEGAIHLVGSKKGDSDIHGLIEEANRHVGFRFEYDEEDVFGRSDQINFYKKGVPVAFLFGGFHPDYHQPSDRVSEINFDKIAAAAKLYYLSINQASEYGRFELKDEKKEE